MNSVSPHRAPDAAEFHYVPIDFLTLRGYVPMGFLRLHGYIPICLLVLHDYVTIIIIVIIIIIVRCFVMFSGISHVA